MEELIDVTPLSIIEETLKNKADKKILIQGVGVFNETDANNILTTFELVDNVYIEEEEDEGDDVGDLSCEVYEVKIDHVHDLKCAFKDWAMQFVNQPDTTEAYRRLNKDILRYGMVSSYMEYVDAIAVYEDVDIKKVLISEITMVMDEGIFKEVSING